MSSTNYLQFDFEVSGPEQSGLLIALLADKGFAGFEEKDDLLSAYILENDFSEEGFSDIPRLFPQFSYSRSRVESVNWNQQWERSFEPVRVNQFAAVRAAFHEPIGDVEHEIIITPKMSFGTGHHATTCLMIEQMSKLDLRHKNVLDFGTGTGVLAILAEKMGAGRVLAMDNDNWSIENLRENMLANNCTHIGVLHADELPKGDHYDIILANINLNVILAGLPSIAGISKTGTRVILSGFLQSDVETLYISIREHAFVIADHTNNGEWVCLDLVYN